MANRSAARTSGKANRRTRDAKKASTAGSKSNRTKDSLTGLSISFDGLGIITSDEVLGKDSQLVKYVSSPDYLASVTSLGVELEFNQDFVVFSSIETGTTNTTTGKIVGRTVFEGDFAYSNGRLNAARIDFMAQVSDSGDTGYGGISYLGITIPNPSSAASWADSINSALDRGIGNIAEYDIGLNTPGAITGNYAAIESFGGGRFFYPGWQADPLASNLIN